MGKKNLALDTICGHVLLVMADDNKVDTHKDCVTKSELARWLLQALNALSNERPAAKRPKRRAAYESILNALSPQELASAQEKAKRLGYR